MPCVCNLFECAMLLCGWVWALNILYAPRHFLWPTMKPPANALNIWWYLCVGSVHIRPLTMPVALTTVHVKFIRMHMHVRHKTRSVDAHARFLGPASQNASTAMLTLNIALSVCGQLWLSPDQLHAMCIYVEVELFPLQTRVFWRPTCSSR